MTLAEEQALTVLKPQLAILDPKTVAYPNKPVTIFVLGSNTLIET